MKKNQLFLKIVPPLHSWMGIFLLLPLLLITLTGIALEVWFYQKNHSPPYILLPNQTPVFVEEAPSSVLKRLITAVQTTHKMSDIKAFYFSSNAHRPHRIEMKNGMKLFFAGKDSLPFAQRPGSDDALFETLVELHRGKYFDTPGRIVFTGIAVTAILLAATGMLLGARHLKNTRQQKRKPPLKTLLMARNMHRVVSWGVGIPIVWALFTGAVLNFSQELRGISKQPLTVEIKDPEQELLQSLATAMNSFQGSRPTGIRVVQGQHLIQFADHSRVYINRNTQTPIAKSIAGEGRGWVELLYTAHTHRWWSAGSVSTVIVLTVGLGFLILLLTGFKVWKKKHRG